MKQTFLFILILIVVIGCGGDDSEAPPGPENLKVTYDVATDGSGKVSFQATADNAVSFDFFFGEGSNLATSSTDGKADHVYALSGSYNVKIVAYNANQLFIDKVITINVEVNEAIPTAGFTSPTSYDGRTLVWQDEFNGIQLDATSWTHETGTGCPNCGWGNNELEYYRENNTSFSDGYLVIRARKESIGGMSYTSSRISTKGKRAFKFGRVDIRALLPRGQGIWPALWMLGSNISSVGWPKCGEIDIMEMIGGGSGRDNKTYGTAHWDQSGYKSSGGNYTLTDGKLLSDEFHVFSIEWTATSITWYIDNVQYYTLDTSGAAMDEFRNDFFIIINLAVGGNWPGNPDATTVFPQRLVVDYIRVFQ